MQRITRKPKLHEFIPTSQKRVVEPGRIEPILDDDGEPVLDEDGNPTHEVIDPVREPIDEPLTFVYRELRRAEFSAVSEIVLREKGEFQFTIDTAYEVVEIVTEEIRNAEIEEDDGSVRPIEIPGDLDLLPAADVAEFGLHVFAEARLRGDQGEK